MKEKSVFEAEHKLKLLEKSIRIQVECVNSLGEDASRMKEERERLKKAISQLCDQMSSPSATSQSSTHEATSLTDTTSGSDQHYCDHTQENTASNFSCLMKKTTTDDSSDMEQRKQAEASLLILDKLGSHSNIQLEMTKLREIVQSAQANSRKHEEENTALQINLARLKHQRGVVYSLDILLILTSPNIIILFPSTEVEISHHSSKLREAEKRFERFSGALQRNQHPSAGKVCVMERHQKQRNLDLVSFRDN